MDNPTPQDWRPSDQRLGTRLAMLRQAMGWGNVKEAALECGLPVESWRAWERDNVQPRDFIRVIRQIAAATECDYYWLLEGSPRPETGKGTNHVQGPEYSV